MSGTSTKTNMGVSIRIVSLLASVVLHAGVLATVIALIGESGTGPAESSSSLHVSIVRSEPADDMPRDNQDLTALEQSSPQADIHIPQPRELTQQPKPQPETIKVIIEPPKPQAVPEQENAPVSSLDSKSQPASNKRGADAKEKQPMQVAMSGRYARLTREYESNLLRLIERHKYYPLRARREGLEGTTMVSFTVSRSGDINGISLARSSGKKLLDQAAIQTIKRIGHAPPLPEGIAMNRRSFMVPIKYDLR